MAYDLTLAIDLGPAQTGIADLRAQLIDTAGANVGTAQSGAVEIGGGNYLFPLSAIPDDHAGGVVLYQAAAPASILIIGAIDPMRQASISEASIHDALDTWEPSTTEPVPPIILPPASADDCRVYIWIKGQYSTEIPAYIQDAKLQITGLPYVASTSAYTGEAKSPTYDPASGSAYWDVVRGAAVIVTIPSHGIRKATTIPDAATLDLTTILP